MTLVRKASHQITLDPNEHFCLIRLTSADRTSVHGCTLKSQATYGPVFFVRRERFTVYQRLMLNQRIKEQSQCLAIKPLSRPSKDSVCEPAVIYGVMRFSSGSSVYEGTFWSRYSKIHLLVIIKLFSSTWSSVYFLKKHKKQCIITLLMWILPQPCKIRVSRDSGTWCMCVCMVDVVHDPL